jgi:hypothetical protein
MTRWGSQRLSPNPANRTVLLAKFLKHQEFVEASARQPFLTHRHINQQISVEATILLLKCHHLTTFVVQLKLKLTKPKPSASLVAIMLGRPDGFDTQGANEERCLGMF